MKTNTPIFRTLLCAAGILLCLSLATAPVRAGNATWTGSGADNKWTNPLNWGVVAPSPLDFLFWGSGNTTSSNDFPAGTTFANLQFNSGAAPFTLVGNGILLTNAQDTGNGIVAGGTIVNRSASAQTIRLPITFSGGNHFFTTVAGAGALKLNGPITRNTGATTVFTVTGGSINFTNSGLVNVSNILGGWAILDTEFASLDSNHNVVAGPQGGYLNIASGPLSDDPSANYNYTFGAADITAGNISINSLHATVSGASARSLTQGGNTLKLGANGGIYRSQASGTSRNFTVSGGTLTARGGGEITLANGNVQSPTFGGGSNIFSVINSLIVSSAIADDGSNPVRVNTLGYMTVSGNNAFTGGIFVNMGRIQAQGSANCLGRGRVTVYPGGEVFYNAALTFTNDFDIAGTGPDELDVAFNGPGALRFNNVNAVATGKITLLSDSRITTTGTSTTPKFTGQITGTGNLELGAWNGNALLQLANIGPANNWNGKLTIRSFQTPNRRTTIQLGANEQIPDATSVTIMSGDVSRLDMNGFSETIDGLTAAVSANNQVTNSSATTATLAVGAANATATFGGNIYGALNFIKAGAGVQTLSGVNSYTGNTIVTNGTLALSGPASIDSSAGIHVAGGTLDVSRLSGLGMTTPSLAMTNAGLTVTLNPNVTNLVATTLTTGGTTNLINIFAVNGLSGAAYPTQFTVIKFGAFNSNSFFTFGTLPSASTQGYITNDGGSIMVVLTNGPKPLTWAGTDGTNPTFWDIATTTNWLFAGSPFRFNDADSVLFDDAGGATNVNVTTVVTPGFVTVSNATKPYTLGGAGGITGAGGLVKQGASTLTLLGANDDFTGGVTADGGTIILANNHNISGGLSISAGAAAQVGTNGGTGNLPTGDIANNGSLLFRRGADLSVPAVISGNGTVTNDGAGVLTLAGVNTFTGAVAVVQGTLKMGSAAALGATNNGTVVAGGSLDVNGFSAGAEPVIVQGQGVGNNGAIVNSGAGQNNALRFVTLSGNATFGGSNRWDVRSANVNDATQGSLLSGGAGHNLTKVGTNQISLVGLTVDSALGNIDIQQGTLGVESATTGLGDPSKTNFVQAGATLFLWNLTTPMDKYFVLNGSGTNATVEAGSGDLPAHNTLRPVSGGSVVMNGTCIFDTAAGANQTLDGTISGGGGLIKRGAGTNYLLGAINYTGTTVVSNGTLIVSGAKGSGGGVTVTTAGALGGTGSIGENVAATGRLIPGSPISQTGTLTVSGNLTLNSNTNIFTLLPGGTGSKVVGINNLTVNGTSWIRVVTVPLQPLNVNDTFTLFDFSGVSNADTNNLQIEPLPGYSFHLTTNATSVQLVVDTAIGNLEWRGNLGTPGVWDNGTTNWVKVIDNSIQMRFTVGDIVTFNDAGVTNVNITAEVGPAPDGLITFANTDEKPYTLQGSGSITGATGMRLIGNGFPSVLIIANSNSFSGPILLDNGTLRIGNGGSSGSIGTASIIATNISGSFFAVTPVLLDRGDSNLTISGAIQGALAVTNIGSGMVTLSGANTFTGGVYVASGTVRVNNNAALGGVNTNQPVCVVSNGAALDVGAPTLAANALDMDVRTVAVSGTGVGGTGAIVNSSTNSQQNALQQVTLTGDTTFGGGSGTLTWTNTGNPGRWDIRGTSLAASNAFLSTGNQPFNLTKIGSNQVTLVLAHVDPFLANINVQSGCLGFEGTSSMGDPASNLTVNAGATLNFFQQAGAPNDFTKVFVLNGDGTSATLRNQSGIAALNGSMSLSGPCVFEIGGVALTNLATLSGGGSLTKNGAGLLVQSGSGGHSGNTTVNNGILSLNGGASISSSPVIDIAGATAVLDVTGIGGSLVRGSGQTIQGNGTLWGSLTLNNGGTNSPGGSIGTLTVTNAATLNGGSTTVMEIDPGLGASDRLVVSNNLQYGGTLTVVTNGALAAGTFQLFSAGSISGTFSQTNLPVLPAPYYWTNVLLNGSVSIAVSASGPSTNASILSVRREGANIIIHGTNNNGGQNFRYEVLTATNLAVPLSNWTSLGTNSFNVDGTFDYTNGINPSQPRRFYDVKAVP